MHWEIDKVWGGLIAVILAVSGGLARMIHENNGKPIKLAKVAGDMFIAGFSGVMAYLVAIASGLDNYWAGIAAGMAGYSGPRALDILLDVILRAVKK